MNLKWSTLVNFSVSSISSKRQKKICRIVVKMNSFVQFLEEFSTWQFGFKINWPLIITIIRYPELFQAKLVSIIKCKSHIDKQKKIFVLHNFETTKTVSLLCELLFPFFVECQKIIFQSCCAFIAYCLMNFETDSYYFMELFLSSHQIAWIFHNLADITMQ